ncbi:MAG: hypothetical protein U7127_15425 [Phormidium sp.]
MRIISDEQFRTIRANLMTVVFEPPDKANLWRETLDLIEGADISFAQVTILPEDQIKIINNHQHSNITVYLTTPDGKRLQVQGVMQIL